MVDIVQVAATRFNRPWARGLRRAPETATPTVTISTSSAITNAADIPAVLSGAVNTRDFRWLFGNPVVAGPQYPNSGSVTSNNLTSNNSVNTIGFEVEVDGTSFEIVVPANSQSSRITVDGQIVASFGADQVTGTAQAGAGTSLTLAAGDSAGNGQYNGLYAVITSGAGAGQARKITAYNSSTKVATVSPAWTTDPGAEGYALRLEPTTLSMPGDGSLQYINVAYSTRAVRTVRYETTAKVFSVRTDSSGSVVPSVAQFGPKVFVVADSLGEGNQAAGPFEGYGYYFAERVGLEPLYLASGGTGVISRNTANGRLNYEDRTTPPTNAWIIDCSMATAGGTYTLTQGGVTTGSIAWNAGYSTVQTALDAAFGANKWLAAGHVYYGVVIIGLGATADDATTMTMTPTGVSGTIQLLRYTGDIAPFVPRDASGKALPFYILVGGSQNDGTYVATMQADLTRYLGKLAARFPTAKILVSGPWMNNGPTSGTPLTLAAAMYAATVASLPQENGSYPLLESFDRSTGVGELNGFTKVSGPSGAAGINTDAYVAWDGTHRPRAGYVHLGAWLAAKAAPILGITP